MKDNGADGRCRGEARSTALVLELRLHRSPIQFLCKVEESKLSWIECRISLNKGEPEADRRLDLNLMPHRL